MFIFDIGIISGRRLTLL